MSTIKDENEARHEQSRVQGNKANGRHLTTLIYSRIFVITWQNTTISDSL